MTDERWNDRDAFTEADFAAVRARVIGKVRRRRRLLWIAAAATATAVVAIGIGVLPAWRAARVPGPPLAASLTPLSPSPSPPPLQRGGKRGLHSAQRRLAAPAPQPQPAPEPAEPLLVKLETSDPDVVIYWIVDSKGDSE